MFAHGSIVALQSMLSFGVGGIVGSLSTTKGFGTFMSSDWITRQIIFNEFTKIPIYGLKLLKDNTFN